MKIKPKAFLTKMGETYLESKVKSVRISQLEETRKILSKYKPKKLLDLGTGNGLVPFYLILNGAIEEVVGIDKDPIAKKSFLSGAKELGLDNYAEFYPHDLNQRLPSTFFGKFDGIISFNTLYYPKPTTYTELFNACQKREEKTDILNVGMVTKTRNQEMIFYNGYGYPINPDAVLSQARDLIRDRGLIMISNICLDTSIAHIDKPGLDYSIGYVVGRNSILDEKEKIKWQDFQKDVEIYRRARDNVRKRFNMKK